MLFFIIHCESWLVYMGHVFEPAGQAYRLVHVILHVSTAPGWHAGAPPDAAAAPLTVVKCSSGRHACRAPEAAVKGAPAALRGQRLPAHTLRGWTCSN